MWREGETKKANAEYTRALRSSTNDVVSFNIRLSQATLLSRIMPAITLQMTQLDMVERRLATLARTTKPLSGLQTPTTVPSYLFAYYNAGERPKGRRLYRLLAQVTGACA